jgi:hypothetical protein
MGKVKPDFTPQSEPAGVDSPSSSKPAQHPSRRVPSHTRQVSKTVTGSKGSKVSKASPVGGKGTKSKPPKSIAKKRGAKPATSAKSRRSKPPSLPPLELSDSFFPPDPGLSQPSEEPLSPSVPPDGSPPFRDEEEPAAPDRLAPVAAQLPPLPVAHLDDVDPLADLTAEIDERFAASLLPGLDAAPPPSGPDVVTTVDDLESVRQLFSEMAGAYLRQVRDFMLELRHTEASTSWIELCEPALQSLRATCEQLETPQLAEALDEYVALLHEAQAAGSGRVEGALRDSVLGCYDRMVALLPEAFEVSGGREPVIVQLLLLQVPGVHKRTVEKLYAAGVHHIEAFLKGKPEELAAVAGIEMELAERIVAKFQDYRRRVSSLVAQSIPEEERVTLLRMVDQLREQNEGYERARAGWAAEDRAAKRRLRRQRGQTLKEIYVVLARMGEVERIDELQKLPVRGQLERLERFLENR